MRDKISVILVLLTATAYGARITNVISSRINEEISDSDAQHGKEETDNAGYNESRIYNGDVVQKNDEHYTFMVAIVVVDRSGNFGVRCGGSLINAQWVLTAGHCVDDLFRQAISENRVVCWVGAYNVGETESSDFRAMIYVKDLVEHSPPYKGKRPGEKEDQRNDIALLRLQSPVNINKFKPICIGNKFYKGGGVTLIGWGRYNGINSPNYLNRANGFIENLQDCKNLYGRNLVHDTMICARLYNKYNGSSEQARGDSGGPLFFSPAQGRYIQVGIVSFNINLNKMNPDNPEEADIPDQRIPGVYTRTYSYIDFMRKTIQAKDNNQDITLCTK